MLRWIARRWTSVFWGAALTLVACGQQVSPATLLPGGTFYPRVVRLAHGAAATNGRLIASTNGVIFESVDAGMSWKKLGVVPTADGSMERCCATLYEVPQKVGAIAAGTLLSAGSYFKGTIPAIEIYASTDVGRTWNLTGIPVISGDAKHGLWEPEFTLADDGALVMFWSDETESCCSQKLVQMRTTDGVLWKDRRDTVATATQSDRPGMATVSRLPDGHFFMTYEVCGPASACSVFYRTSLDGWDYGSAMTPGIKVVTATGQYLEHAPLNVWMATAGAASGSILLGAQITYEADGKVSNLNGRALWVKADPEGAGKWTTVEAPVKVPEAYDNFCPNYSSALLPAADGRSVLELASAYDGSHQCATYFGERALTALR